MAREQLKSLAKKVPEQFISDNGRGWPAMDHTVVSQMLLAKLGGYNFEITHVLRSGTKKDASVEVVTGVIGRLTVEIDGKVVVVEEGGGVENALNQDGDGERVKHAASDALKRCAMRIGLGLHIWSGDHYFLDKLLEREDGSRGRKWGSGGKDHEGASEGSSGAPGPSEVPPPEDVADPKDRMKLAQLIGKAGRDVEKFEEKVGRIDLVSQETCDHWIGVLEDQLKGSSV